MPTHDKKTAQITVRVSDSLYDQLRALAKADDRSLASYIARALQQHVDAIERR